MSIHSWRWIQPSPSASSIPHCLGWPNTSYPQLMARHPVVCRSGSGDLFEFLQPPRTGRVHMGLTAIFTQPSPSVGSSEEKPSLGLSSRLGVPQLGLE